MPVESTGIFKYFILTLFNNLEFTSHNRLSTFITKLIHIKSPVEISKCNSYFVIQYLCLYHFFPHKTIHLQNIAFINVFVKLKIDKRGSWIRITFYYLYFGALQICRKSKATNGYTDA